jgi:hypothetical protein
VPPPPTTGGHDVEIAKLQQNVRGAFVWLGLLSVASGVAFLFLLGRIDTGFEKVNDDVGQLQTSIAAQTATLQAIDARLIRSEDELDERGDNTQASTRGR